MAQSKSVAHESSDDLSAVLARMATLSLSPDDARALAGTLNMLANSVSLSSTVQAHPSIPDQAGTPRAAAPLPPTGTPRAPAPMPPTSTPRAPAPMPPTSTPRAPAPMPPTGTARAAAPAVATRTSIPQVSVAVEASTPSLGAIPTQTAAAQSFAARSSAPPASAPRVPQYHMPPAGSPGPFYVITRGRQVGVFTNWSAIAHLVLRVPGAVFESVHSRVLAQEMFEEALYEGVVEVIVDVNAHTRRPRRR
ncbi:hypothetical protein AB1N83_004401 [Pleurotus pulmonarius]|nr:hypothetical protein EYR36_006057 [Pleurotus pulmonarius]KAF4600763.1 hypothetical protein EYR38_005408 [Pleurotus pulmonarius]